MLAGERETIARDLSERRETNKMGVFGYFLGNCSPPQLDSSCVTVALFQSSRNISISIAFFSRASSRHLEYLCYPLASFFYLPILFCLLSPSRSPGRLTLQASFTGHSKSRSGPVSSRSLSARKKTISLKRRRRIIAFAFSRGKMILTRIESMRPDWR